MTTNLKELARLAKRFSVLYVEDDLDIQGAMVEYLSKLFHHIDVAENGLAGLELFKKRTYDIVISDLAMPKMNGIEMLKEIRNIDEEQMILITSAYAETEYMLEAIKISVDGYILKPFDYNQLNYELHKIVLKLQKFEESKIYKQTLERMIEKKSAIVSSLLDFQQDNYEQTLYAMVEMIEERDTYTAGHSKRVATYAKKIAKAMGYSKEECTKIYQAGMLHDIGKIATPDAVLLNPARLNDIEYNLIKEHVSVGYKLLYNVPMFQELADIIYVHHEYYDGSGYPRGIAKDDINPLGRIMIVVDAFDAMTTNRIYKRSKTVFEAIEELRALSAKQFDPDVVKVAVDVLKDTIIDVTIDQLPKNEIEEKRFAYFYEDTLTHVYNKSYLELLLAQNRYEKNYTTLDLFLLKRFSQYNRDKGWSRGDTLLIELAELFEKNVEENSVVFRIYGDNFVILSKNTDTYEKLKDIVDQFIEKKGVSYEHHTIDMRESEVVTLGDIENMIGMSVY